MATVINIKQIKHILCTNFNNNFIVNLILIQPTIRVLLLKHYRKQLKRKQYKAIQILKINYNYPKIVVPTKFCESSNWISICEAFYKRINRCWQPIIEWIITNFESEHNLTNLDVRSEWNSRILF